MLSYLRRLVLLLLTVLISPVLAVLALVLLAVNFLDRRTRAAKPVAARDSEPLSGQVSIVILNWNGRDLLAQGLPSVLEAVRKDGRDHEVIVVDNGSTDESVEYVRRTFPQVRIVALPSNLGFAAGNNAGVRAASRDIVVLLNNDMVVDPGFIPPLLDGFGPATFAVSSQIFLQDPAARREETGRTSAAFRRGMIDFSHRDVGAESSARPYYPAFWAGGGSAAFHRARFLQLGGFQELFSPAYVEDADISYQAWKAGWEVLFAPGSVVHHKHRASSTRRFKPAELQALIQRNQLLFLWKNITSGKLLMAHALCLPWNCYRLARDFRLPVWNGLLRAALRVAGVAAARRRMPVREVRSDQEIFGLFALPGMFFSVKRREVQPPAPGSDPHAAAAVPDRRPHLLWMTAYLPHLGRHAGAGRMFQLLKRLAPSYRITLLSFLEFDHEEELVSEVARYCVRVVAMRRRPPFRWQVFAYEPFDEFRTPQMEQAMHDCLEREDIDLIQLEYTQMACYGHRSLGIPTLLTKHEVDFAACARRAKTERNLLRKTRWFYNYLQVLDREVQLLGRVDAAVCMTDTDRHELERYARVVPVHVISTGVDLDYFRPPAKPADSPRLVFVGAFQHEPNVDAMAYFCRDILPRIRARVPAVELCIVGSRPPQSIAGLAALPGVTVTGLVPDIRPYMEESAVYIVPLRLGVGIRGKILEAWGMAMPVVATSVAASGLDAEHGKNILIADTEELFAEQAATLLRDSALRGRLGREGRAAAERLYGWNAAAEKLDRLYRDLMHHGNTREAAAGKLP